MNADFEKQLQRQPLRELPRDWRAEILAAAAAPRPSGLRGHGEGAASVTYGEKVGRAVPCPPRRARSARPTSQDGWLTGEGTSTWPSLRAWAALAAVWGVIFLLHLTAPDEPRLARNSSPMTLQSFAILHQQTLMMAQLLGQTDQPDAGEPPAALPAPPKPRSEIARKQLMA